MTKSLLQLTWWKVVNIRPFCWLRNECVFCTCKQHSDSIPDLKGVHFPSYLLLDFFIFLSFWMVLPPISFFRLLFLRTVIIGSTEKVSSKALLVFKMDLWFSIIYFILGRMRLYVIVSDNTWAFCVAFGVSKPFLSRSLIFLISVSIEDESQSLFVNCSCNTLQLRSNSLFLEQILLTCSIWLDGILFFWVKLGGWILH